MKTSDLTDKIFTAIAGAQAAMDAAKKGAENPAFKRDGKVLKYADLSDHWATIRPVAKAFGLAIIQELLTAEHGVEVVTRIAHSSGQWVECGPMFVPASKADAHGYGSACSYARRYALSAAFGTVADDDDGNAAVKSKDTPYVVPEPIGYQEWLTDMKSLSESVDIDVYRASYANSSKKFRIYLETTDRPAMLALAERAKKNPTVDLPI